MGIEVTKADWKKMKKVFEAVDTNDDGALDLNEVEAAIEAHEGSFLKIKAKAKEDELTAEQEAEVKPWVENELANGGTITMKEAQGAIKAFAAKHGIEVTKADWKKMKKVFEAVDTNDDGALDLNEVEAALEGHSFLGLKDAPELTEEQAAEIEAWVKEQLDKDGDITKAEAVGGIEAFAKKHGFEITNEMWAELEAAFDAADCNGDGKLVAREIK